MASTSMCSTRIFAGCFSVIDNFVLSDHHSPHDSIYLKKRHCTTPLGIVDRNSRRHNNKLRCIYNNQYRILGFFAELTRKEFPC